MKVGFFFIVLITVTIACNKGKFETAPTIEIKSISPDVVVKGNFITLKARVTDKEGDVQDSVFLTTRFFEADSLIYEETDSSLNISVLNFPNSRDIELEVQFLYGESSPNTQYIPLQNSDRSFSAGLVIVDKSGNRSKYAESGKILLKKL